MDKNSSVARGFIFCLLTLAFASCQKEQETVYSVPEELQPFVDTLMAEAALRNVTIDIADNLIIEYGGQTEGIICGSCVFIGKQRKIEIDKERPCWSDNITKEALMLHMLGHCVLNRIEHDDNILPNGDPKSLVSGESIDQYACVFDLDGNNNCNNLFKREYYLDELFDPATQAPDWAE